jgi:hypothetical protein
MTWLGIVLIAIGLFFIVLSMVGAAQKVFQEARQPGAHAGGAFDPAAWAKLVTAAGKFVQVAPLWLLLAAAGAGFIAWGTTMIG